MQLSLPLTYKKFSACELGELIRPTWANGALAIKASNESGQRSLLVFLEDPQPGETAPRFVASDGNDFHVLSYGTDFEFELVESGPREINPNKLWTTNGSISICPDGCRNCGERFEIDVLTEEEQRELERQHKPISQVSCPKCHRREVREGWE